MSEIDLEEFAKELKLIKVVTLDSEGHGDRLTRFFVGHKGICDGQ